ncbi:MAG: nuclear transport factor 2 family protein [Acidobacteriota bacterium]
MKNGVTALVLFWGAIQTSESPPPVSSELVSIVEAERAFAQTAAAKGIRQAFLQFLGPDGILFHSGPVNGQQWWKDRPAQAGLLSWFPIFAAVSKAGDLGYTTGPFEYRKEPEAAKPDQFGHYVTVWNRSGGGPWRVAVDLGTVNPGPEEPFPDWKDQVALCPLPSSAGAHPDPEISRAALRAVDRKFSEQSASQSLAPAVAAHASSHLRLFRMNRHPIVGKQKALDFLAEQNVEQGSEALQVEVSASADLGYCYGRYWIRAGSGGEVAETGHYLRIWQHCGQRWQLVLDILYPLPSSANSQ